MDYEYTVAVHEDILGDEIALRRLYDRILDRAQAQAYEEDLEVLSEDSFYTLPSKPIPSYNEDGKQMGGDVVLISVVIPVRYA